MFRFLPITADGFLDLHIFLIYVELCAAKGELMLQHYAVSGCLIP